MQDSQTLETPAPSGGENKLWTRGFIALLATQFMVALNDNIFRWLIIPIGKWAIGWTDKADQIRMIGSLAFVLPFIYLVLHTFTWLKMRRIKEGRALNECLGETARNMLVYGLCVAIGLLI